MTSRAALFAGLLASAVATASCGESVNAVPVTPVGPSSLSDLLLPRLNGLWGGDLTLIDVAGGTGAARNAGALACVGAAFAGVVGEVNYNSLAITQSGTDLTAKLVSESTGLACTYKGTIGSGTNLVMQAEACTPKTLTILCHPDPVTGVQEVRELDLVGSSLTASFDDPINVTQIRGTAAHTYNIKDEGALVAKHSFTNLTRR
jgi:hypothetical protein